MAYTLPFKCPKCGGPYGGAETSRVNGEVDVTGEWRCHCNEFGEGYSGRVEPGALPLKSNKPCGWRGTEQECLTQS